MKLDRETRKKLLETARRAVEASLSGAPTPPLDRELADLGPDQGAFVTLHLHGQLRGCIGNFQGRGPLAATVQEMAVSAARRDPRFRPISDPDELAQCQVEISALSTLEPIDPDEVVVGKHGLYLIRGINRGVLLPQVPVEQGWDRETFLDQTCVKAGMEPGCWRTPGTTILGFTAEVFGEEE